MYQKSILWLLCATILPNMAAVAADDIQIKKPVVASAEMQPQGKPSGLTLEAAIAVALRDSPRLKAYGSSVEIARGARRQAGAWANPELSYSRENFGGGGAYKAISPQQNSYGVSQLIEIGGKVSAREMIADKALEIAVLEQQAAALDVVRDVSMAYAEAVAAEENVRLAREQKELAEDVLISVGVRVGAAAAPLIQKSRAEVERATAGIALDTAMKANIIARKNLATMLGEEQVSGTLDSHAFFAIRKPDLPRLEETLNANPDLLKLGRTLEQSRGVFDLEKANALPDPRINLGMVDIPSARDQAFVLGVSLPIPVFNGNRGNIDKARSALSKNELENRQAMLTLHAELTRAQQQMENAYLQAQTLKAEIMPSANKAFTLAREGYGLGRFPYLEVLDAQRSLFGVKQQHIAALKEYHIARAAAERLAAVHLETIRNQGEVK